MPLRECRICHDMSVKINDFAVDLMTDFEDFAAMALTRANYAGSIGATDAAIKLRAISHQLTMCAGLAENVFEADFSGYGRRRGWASTNTLRPPSSAETDVAQLTYRVTPETSDEVEEYFLVACQDMETD